MEAYTEFAVKHFFRERNRQPYFKCGVVNAENTAVEILTEADKLGKTELTVSVEGESLWLIDFDKHDKCMFFAENKEYGLCKSSDHVIFQCKGGVWYLHIIEFKTAVRSQTWKDVKKKFRTSYFNCMALAKILGIAIPDENVYAYTTYEKECYGKDTASPAELRPILGEKAEDPMQDWNNGQLYSLPLAPEKKVFKHTKIQVTRIESGLVGSLAC